MKYKLNEKKTRLRRFLASPFITLIAIPIIILDICVEIYHHIAFRLYQIPLIKRSRYIRIDRHRLKYLSFKEKIYCAYCGYANGFINYAAKIAAETEEYFCGIKHEMLNDFIEPKHHDKFAAYNNQKEFEKKYCKLKK